MSLEVRAATAADMPGAHALRDEVFVRGQGVPAELEHDDKDATAVHAVAVADGAVVGTGRLLTGEGAGVIGRMAVVPSMQSRGIGGRVLACLEGLAIDAGIQAIELHAQVPARRFYERAGYAAYGSIYLEAGLEHISMRKPLPVIRLVRDSDSAALIELIGACFAEYPGCVLSLDEEPWLREPASAYQRIGGQMWVVTVNDAVVACIGLRLRELKNLYVAAQARRGGLGSRLVRLVESAAGPGELRLWSDTRFVDAHRLYERLGYWRTGSMRELHDLSDTTEYEFAKQL